MKRYRSELLVLYCLVLLLITVGITGKCQKLIITELKIRDVVKKEIDYDSFRNVRINKKNLEKIRKLADECLTAYPYLAGYPYTDYIGYLTFSMMMADYDLVGGKVPDIDTFLRGIGRVLATGVFKELYPYYKAIFSDIRYFPIPSMGKNADTVSFEDSWMAPRSYGGNRKHEGTDIMSGNNIRGYFPVVSITNGTVEKIGWLEKGGNRIGIRADSGAYFYYAHLDSYAPGLKAGDYVTAGQLLGFMGDSGYGKEGTVGKFDVHLHLGIYVPSDSIEMSVNPYWILTILEDSRTELVH
jgi:Peptidase family M23.